VSGRIRTSPSSRYSVLAEDPNHDRVRNIGVLRAFYRALRWRKLLSGDDAWTGFLLGSGLSALFPLPDLTFEARRSHVPTGWSGVTLACTVSTREEVDTAFAAAVAAGATPVAEATDRSWGGRSAFMAGRLPDPLF
jgi:hypothetical protein